MKLATLARPLRYAIWQNRPVTAKNGCGVEQTLYCGEPKPLYDHWGKPIIFETLELANAFLRNPPAPICDIPRRMNVFIHPTNCTRKAGNPRGISFL